MAKELSSPSFETGMLAYARSVQITEGLFFATSVSDRIVKTPIEVLEKGVRGQSSEDKAKNPGKSNPQSVEYAVIPQGHDGVELSYSIRFMPLSLHPHACGNTTVGKTYTRLAKGYKKADGYKVLAELFTWNIANARFAWRNRFQSDSMTVTAKFNNQEISFNPFKVSLEKPDDVSVMKKAIVQGNAADIEALIEGIAHGLSNADRDAFTVEIRWNAVMQPGQEIFPSQEYLREAKAKEYENLSRVYAKLPTRCDGRIIEQASMHSQKIGAALRHIDIWHGRHDAAIAVNPYGGVQETSDILRDPKSKKSFYDLRKKAEPLLHAVESASVRDDLSGDVHFIMANLVRGGVFGSSDKKAEANG